MSFYVLQPERGRLFGTKWAYGEVAQPAHTGVSHHCPVCGRPIGMLRWLPPHRLSLSSAKAEKWGDFLWGAGFRLMVSARFKGIYEAEGLSGITLFYPSAEIVRIGRRKAKDSLSPPSYHLIEIVWNGANLDDKASGVVRKRIECEFHRGAIESLERIMIDSGSWTGVDIFEARGLLGETLVSERFKQTVQSYGLKNVGLIPVEEYAYDEHRPGLWYVRDVAR